MKEILFFKAKNKTMFFKKELLQKFPNLVIGHLKQFNFASQFSDNKNLSIDYLCNKFALSPSSKLYNDNKKDLNKNDILGLTYAIRAGRIVRTRYQIIKGDMYIIRDIVGTKDRICMPHCYLGLKDSKRKYIEGKVFIDILAELKDNEPEFLKQLEIFIGEVFRQFRDNNLLKPEVYDATPINCLKLQNGKLYFFDFEFENTDGVTKECMLYKIIHYVCNYFNMKDNFNKYYEYYRVKFNLENKLNWCEYYELHYSFFDCPLYFEDRFEHYNKSLYVKTLKTLCKILTSMIPKKEMRYNVRNKLVQRLCYPNYSLINKYGLDDTSL